MFKRTLTFGMIACKSSILIQSAVVKKAIQIMVCLKVGVLRKSYIPTLCRPMQILELSLRSYDFNVKLYRTFISGTV